MDYSDVQSRIKQLARPSTDEYFLLMASLISTRSTCGRRRVGCVLVNRFKHVIATGYNGVASGLPHCIDRPCPGRNLPSGEGLHLCEAIHAEENALMQCQDIGAIHTIYTTASPCIKCIRLLMGTSCQRIVFIEEYPHNSRELWEGDGRKWIHNNLK